ncbi:MAG: methyltransferase domain-containing protein [Rhodobacteraceae bacterium]|nr:methyltransferase domain-containing protein [Paracoccaceae bacterium]
MSERFLDKVYEVTGPKETQALYEAWAQSYDAEVGEHGYATPGRCAKALFSVMPKPQSPILDFGCGTGLSGLALHMAGFEVIDGMDMSQAMLAKAQEKAIYRRTFVRQAGTSDICAPGDYDAIAAIGVIGAGAAPITLFDDIVSSLAAGGFFTFSFNDHTLMDPSYEAKLDGHIQAGAVQLLARDHGDHLPGIGLKSTIYVVRKL